MGADRDLLFGRIAVDRAYCTQDQIDRCVALQARSPDRLPIGHLLMREGYLTEAQHFEILAIQRKNLAVVDPLSKASRETVLIGKLAVREKLLTERDLNQCLMLQGRQGEKRSIGEIMVAQGFVTPAQLKGLLSRQQKKIMSCPACRLSFTVLTVSRSKVIACPRCKGPLSEGKPSDSVRTDAHLETAVARKLKNSAAPPPAPAAPGPSSSIRMVRMNCPMCAKPFQEAVDSKGRVDCPHCQSSFSA